MKIRTKRISMVVLLLVGIFWNCLCLCHMLPADLFRFSMLVPVGCILLTPKKPDEKSAQYSALAPEEKRLSILTIVLAAVWAVLLIVCVIIDKIF